VAIDTEELRGDTVVETIQNVVHRYFGDSVPVPDDVISAVLVLAAKIDGITSIPEANAQALPNSEIDALINRGEAD